MLVGMTDPAPISHAAKAARPKPAPRAPRRRDAGAVSEVCPLLVSADAAWRSAYASRDHRCWAVRPPAPLVLAKQRELCLTDLHAGCATYLASLGGVPGDLERPRRDPAGTGSLLWPAVRSTPLALEPSRGRTGTLLPAPARRIGGQAVLVGLMVVAFLVLVIARATAPSPPAAANPTGSAASSGGIVGSPTPAPASTPSGSAPASESVPPVATPTPTGPSATPGREATPVPGGLRRYRVQPGDTLGGIAAKFGTTVKALAEANGITNPSLIRVGQVLVIP